MTRHVQFAYWMFALAMAIELAWLADAATAQNQPNAKSAASPGDLRKDADTFLKMRFSRQTEEAFRAVVASPADDADEAARLAHDVQSGNWLAVRGFLRQFEPEAARRMHSKICSDLAFAQPKSIVLPQDVIALADASSVELDERQVIHLGALLKLAVRDSESRTELLELLHRGTERLGGTDAHRRRMAARLLAGADLYTEAKTFGISEKELRSGIVAEPEEAPAPKKRTWSQLLAVLRDATTPADARAATLDELHLLLLAAPAKDVDQLLRALVADAQHPESARLVYGVIGQKTAAASREVDFAARTAHVELLHQAMQALAPAVKIADEPWRTLANLSASNWLVEAQHSLKTFPTWLKASTATRDRYPHVPLEQVIENAPNGSWLAVVEPQLATMIRVTLVRLILLSENIDRAVPWLRELVRVDGPAAAKLANSFLETWASRHDPNLSPELLRQYRLENQVVVLTRAQQDANLKQLGGLLSSLDGPTRQALDATQLVRAFDFCHSRAEVFTQAHVVEVFGPIEQMPAGLTLALAERMREKSSSQWRDLTVQRDAATRRSSADVFQMVNHGYDEATSVATRWLASHADDWRMNCTVGSLLSDWAEFAYFQTVASGEDSDRFSDYLKHADQATAHFRAGAKAYAATVGSLKRSEFDLLPYRAWFHGLLGITHEGGVNLRKGVTREGLDEVRRAMLALPGDAGEAHLEMFSAMVADKVTANSIAPEMKYRYLSSAVRITGSRATVYPAEEKIKYYDSLLKEIRLQARIDGSDRIRADGAFGLFVSLQHTVDVARESGGFGKYLTNEVQKTVSGRSVIEKPQYRDRFEESLRVALGDFFEIRSIVFADPKADVQSIESQGASPNAIWQEMPLAYLLLKAKDTTIDRVPALDIELDFFDRSGKVVIPVPSNPIQIEIAPDASGQRPATNVAVTQIVDARELAEGRLKIDVVATAHGMAPELDQLLRISDYALTALEMADNEGLQVRELHGGAEGMHVLSERSWTIHLDPAPLLRGAKGNIDFEFPEAQSADTRMTYRRYQDLDPVEAAAKCTLVEGEEVGNVSRVDYRLWGAGGVGLVAVGLFAWGAWRKKPTDEADAPPLFVLPRELTPFSVIALLHRIQASRAVPLSDEQRRQLRDDIRALEQETFARQGHDAAAQDLDALARGWLNVVLPLAARGQAA